MRGTRNPARGPYEEQIRWRSIARAYWFLLEVVYLGWALATDGDCCGFAFAPARDGGGSDRDVKSLEY